MQKQLLCLHVLKLTSLYFYLSFIFNVISIISYLFPFCPLFSVFSFTVLSFVIFCMCSYNVECVSLYLIEQRQINEHETSVPFATLYFVYLLVTLSNISPICISHKKLENTRNKNLIQFNDNSI